MERYIKPETIIVKVDSEAMLAGSDPTFSTSNPTPSNGWNSGLSKTNKGSSSLWDLDADEIEEEENN